MAPYQPSEPQGSPHEFVEDGPRPAGGQRLFIRGPNLPEQLFFG
jgi:hypothetical protein